MDENGKKFDDGKPRMELIDRSAAEGLAAVLAFGARKYGENNWRGGIRYGRLSGALLRHLYAFLDGEDLDPETGLPHIDHVACNAMFLQWMSRNRKDMDDRYLSGGLNAEEDTQESRRRLH